MKGLETGKDKVKKICDVLRKETLEPAKHEAEELRESARRHADEILASAKDAAERMVGDARKEIERQKVIFQASLAQACRQTIETLKEKIQHQLFNSELSSLMAGPMQDPKVGARLIDAVVAAIEKEGIDGNLSAYISSAVPAREVTKLIASSALARLKEKSVLLSSIGGGVEVKLLDDHITIDLSDVAIKELIGEYIRKDFRDLVFSA